MPVGHAVLSRGLPPQMPLYYSKNRFLLSTIKRVLTLYEFIIWVPIMFEFFWFLIIGLIAGWPAGKIMKESGYGLIGDLVTGVLGALIGGPFSA
jgi:hypothetical protein